MMRSIAPRPERERFLTWAGVLFLAFGAALTAAPFPTFVRLVRLLPWLFGVLAVLSMAACLRKKPFRKVPMLFAGIALGAGVWLGVMGQYRDRVLWYLAAGVLAWSAVRVLGSALRPGAGRWSRVAGALTALTFAGLMVCRPRSGFSAALTLFGVFVLAWGVMLLTLPPRNRPAALSGCG